jgi:hypothetical protein
LQIDLIVPTVVNRYAILTGTGSCPSAWTWSGSYDGSAFFDIHSVSGQSCFGGFGVNTAGSVAESGDSNYASGSKDGPNYPIQLPHAAGGFGTGRVGLEGDQAQHATGNDQPFRHYRWTFTGYSSGDGSGGSGYIVREVYVYEPADVESSGGDLLSTAMEQPQSWLSGAGIRTSIADSRRVLTSSCKEALAAGAASTAGGVGADGVYALLSGDTYCDMSTDGGGWTYVA